VGCPDPQVRALVAAGTPVSRPDFAKVDGCNKPKLFIQGAHDEFGSPEELRRFVASLEGVTQLKIIEGADHFFEGHLPELFQVLLDFIGSVDEAN
jgi:alpha/beta superfamily hydrolase